MPLYNYKCPTCNHEEEVLMGYNDSDPLCPHCAYNPEVQGKDEIMIRQYSPTTNFILKGRGWAYDGYSKETSLKKGKPKYNDYDK